MPLNLHPDCKVRIAQYLNERLNYLEIENNKFLSQASLVSLVDIDDILSKKTRKELTNIIGEYPLLNFVIDRLSYYLDSRVYTIEQNTQKLTELEDYNNPQELAEKLTNEFESLPWMFTVFVKLPDELTRNLKLAFNSSSYIISDDFSLIIANDSYEQNYPNPINRYEHSILESFFDKTPKWERNGLYLEFKLRGYIGHFFTSTLIHNYEFLIRSLFGLGLIIKLFRIKKWPLSNRGGRVPMMTYQRIENAWEVRNPQYFTLDFSQAFNNIDIPQELLDKKYDSMREELIKNWLLKMVEDFEIARKDMRILKALQWFFDSNCGYNELLSFVQATTVLEILLGDKTISDIVGLGELLRNRCAYLIGKTRTERETIMENFKRIYNTRSEIVHQGKNQLNSQETADLDLLRYYCFRVIEVELEQLKHEPKE